MRVLHVLNGTGGGSTVSALELVKASRAAGTGIEHCAVYPGRLGYEDPEIHRIFHRATPISLPTWNSPKNLDLVRRIVLVALSRRESGFGFKTMRTLGQLIRDWSIDLVTTNCAVNIHGALAAQKAGIPHVWHIRERIGTGGSMQFRLDDRRLVHRIAGLSTKIAAVSEYVAAPFREYGADVDLEVVYDGVDVASFDNQTARERGTKLRKEWGIADGMVLVGKVANVTAHVKRHDLFIRAAAEVIRHRDDVCFVVVGEIPSQDSWFSRPAFDRWQALKGLAHDLGLDGRLIWAGSVNDPPAVMNAIDILGHACDIEGFPRVVIEAMAAGKPVVGPASAGVLEGAGEAGIMVEAGSPGQLACGIESLTGDLTACKHLGGEGHRRVVGGFTLAKHAMKMVDLYQSACNSCLLDPVQPDLRAPVGRRGQGLGAGGGSAR
jgi:glycosyltransferase involved in cell wall biosynthesis